MSVCFTTLPVHFWLKIYSATALSVEPTDRGHKNIRGYENFENETIKLIGLRVLIYISIHKNGFFFHFLIKKVLKN